MRRGERYFLLFEIRPAAFPGISLEIYEHVYAIRKKQDSAHSSAGSSIFLGGLRERAGNQFSRSVYCFAPFAAAILRGPR